MYRTEEFHQEYGIEYMKIIENQGHNNRNVEVEGHGIIPWYPESLQSVILSYVWVIRLMSHECWV